MKTNPKTGRVTVPVDNAEKIRFVEAMKAEDYPDRDMSKLVRLLMGAYCDLIKSNPGVKFATLRLCEKDEVIQASRPILPPATPGAGRSLLKKIKEQTRR